jgi:hypothetical protein
LWVILALPAVVLVLAGVGGYRLASDRMAKQVVAGIETEIAKHSSSALFSKDEVTADPWRSTAVLKGVSIKDPVKGFEFKAENAVLKSRRAGLAGMFFGSEIDRQLFLNAVFKQPRLEFTGKDVAVFADEATYEFEGNYETKGPREFPHTPFTAGVSVKELGVEGRKVSEALLFAPRSGDGKKLTRIDSLSIKASYTPNPRRITVHQLNSVYGALSSTGAGVYDLEGDNWDTAKVGRASTNGKTVIKPPGLIWGIPAVTGEYSVQEASLESSFVITPGQEKTGKCVPETSLTWNIREINAALAGPLAQQVKAAGLPQLLGINPEKIAVHSVNVSFHTKDNRSFELKTSLDTDIGNGELLGDVDVDCAKPDRSIIKSGVLRLSNLSDGLLALVRILESQVGVLITPGKKEIVVEASGPAGNPEFKGVSAEAIRKLTARKALTQQRP